MKKTLLLLTILLMVASGCLTKAEMSGKKIKTKCFPIQIDDRARTNYPFGVQNQLPDLIFIGSSSFEKEIGQDNKFNTKVDEIFYGWTDKKVLDFSYPWRIRDGKMILALVRAKYPKKAGATWQHKYSLAATPENIAAAKALGQARLTYYTLMSNYIVVGKELSFAKDKLDDDVRRNGYLRNVQVKDVLFGPTKPELKGKTILASVGGFVRWSGGKPCLMDREMIYFIPRIKEFREEKITIYSVLTSVPGPVQDRVKMILRNRDSFPVKNEVRKITFQGSTEKAIFIMGSESRAAIMLVQETLNNRGDEARKQVLAAIKQDMLNFNAKPPSTYIRLKNLISFLGSTKEGKQDLAKLLDQMLEHIATAKPVPMSTMPERKYQRPEVKRVDTNHCLLWVLQNIDRKVLVADFAKKLSHLTQISKTRWQSELQLAINSIALQDIIDLSKNLIKSAKVTPLRSVADFNVQGEKLVFIPGNTQIMVDGRIYRIKDWQQIGQVTAAEHYQALISPNGKVLYLLGSKNGNVQAVAFPSGKILRMFKKTEGSSYGQGVLTSDGKVLMAVNNADKLIQLWNTKTGNITKSFPLGTGRYHATLSPNGKILAWQSADNKEEVIVQRLNDGKKTVLKIGGHKLTKLLFTQNNRYLLILSYGFPNPNNFDFVPQLAVYDANKNFQKISEVAIKEDKDRCDAMAISPDGKYAALGGQEGKVWLLDLPHLKTKQLLISDKACGFFQEEGQLKFSRDSKLLAVGGRYTNLRLFKTEANYEQILIGDSHPGKINDAYFSADGKTVRTYGNQGYVCTWDLDVMKVIKRICLPFAYKTMGISPDGRYVVCFDSAKIEETSGNYGSQLIPAKIVDVATGKVISQPILPLDQYRSRIHWINNHEAFISSPNEICRFDYLTGKIIKNLKVDNKGWGQLTEDGKQMFLSRKSGGKFTTRDVTVWYINPNTGKESAKTKVEQEIRGGYNAYGLIPGGKYFYYGDPDMYILSRKTGKLMAYKDFVDADLLKVAFSPDGSKYAVVTGARKYVDDIGIWDSKTKSIVLVHDALSGKMLFACKSPVRFPRALQFSPDGKRLLVSGEDFFEIWPINKVKK